MGSSSTLTSESVVWLREETWQVRARAEEWWRVQVRWSQRITSQSEGKWQTWNFDKQPHNPEPWRISCSSQYWGGLMDRLMDCWQRAQLALPVLNFLLMESDGLAACKCSWSVPEQKMCKYFTACKALTFDNFHPNTTFSPSTHSFKGQHQVHGNHWGHALNFFSLIPWLTHTVTLYNIYHIIKINNYIYSI